MQNTVAIPFLQRVIGRSPAGWFNWVAAWMIAVSASSVAAARGDAPVEKSIIKILHPPTGLVLEAPGKVIFEAQAVDPAGDIRHLEFFANDTAIGVSDFLLKIATIPGRPIPHRLEWSNIPAGVYRVVARGTDTVGDLIESDPVEILVRSEGDQPVNVVSLTATWPQTGEPSPLARVAPGRLLLSRTGDTTFPLAVFLEFGGTAQLGIDYVRPRGLIEIPPGKADTEIFIQAIEDDVVEGTESVVVTLRDDPSMSILPRYRVDPEHARAEVAIHDGDQVDQPTIVIQKPANGAVFTRGTAIEIEATAIDPDGYINRVEFFAGDRRIGESEILFIVAPPDGSPIRHVLEWKDAPVGDHKLTVRAGSDPAVAVQSETVLITVKDRAESSLTLTAPEADSQFAVGQPIEIQAVAVDSKGYISRVEFFDGDRSIGVSELAFLVAPEPGTPIHHSLVWKEPRPGRHALSARAVTTGGERIRSTPVPIVVGLEAQQVVLALEATDAVATEPTSNADADPGVFVLRRVAGPKDVDLVAYLRWDGSAKNGVDFGPLEETVKLPAGVGSVELVIKPLADNSREGTEQVVVELLVPPCIEIYPPPPECYRIDGGGTARVLIRDDRQDIQNRQPRVAITDPKSGSVHAAGQVIVVKAEASDADGRIVKLEVFDGETSLGGSSEPTLALEWKDAAAGLHRLRARATDDQGESADSGAVVVFVRELEELAFVKRQLPPAYLPGGAIEVHLLADPPRGGGAWTVEDAPPAGWVVSDISDDGAFDVVRGRVKFGPFTDGKSRDLHYRVTAAQNAAGPQKFAGSASLDGRTYPVVGDDTVDPAGEHHPADMPSPNKAISADELTAYASAWLLGRSWGADESSIPLSYVSRAGFLWKSGEAYIFDPAKGGPPECWIPASAGGALAVTSKALETSETAAAVVGGARRKSPSQWKPGRSGRVEIELRPPVGTLALAVEEAVPAGWKVSSVSDEGVVDPETGRIRWGLLYGATARVLSYNVTPPADTAGNGRFAGMVSFDGGEAWIDGMRLAGATDDRTAVRITGSRRDSDGKLHLKLEAAANQIFVVEGSSDLRVWEELDARVFTGDEIAVEDATTGSVSQRYYRLRPVDR